MKTFLNTFSFILITTFCYSQSETVSTQTDEISIVDSVNDSNNSKIVTKKSAALKNKFSTKHSQKAVNQLRLFLAKNVNYPLKMVENNQEGKIVLEVVISNLGKIIETRVFRGLNEEFDQAALDAMKSVKKIDLEEKVYYGNRKVYVPVVFTLTDF